MNSVFGAKGSRMKATYAIALGGLTAGTLDIAAAALINDRNPVFILHAIAGGILGTASFSGGAGTAILGLFLQWAISLAIAAIYVIASRPLPVLCRLWPAGSAAYGVAIFLVMNYVVVPLSAYGRFPHFTAVKAVENLLAMLLFGLIVAFFARRGSATAG
jgi:hypothetical protein